MGVLTKNEKYFNEAFENYFNHFLKDYLMNDNLFNPERRDIHKKSYQYFCTVLFEESIGKNGKDIDKILYFEANNFEFYDLGNWNAFFIRNILHQFFSSNSQDIDIKSAYDHIISLNKELKKSYKATIAYEHLTRYIQNFEVFEIIKFIKIIC